MKREQLTNVTTESIDQRCAMLAAAAMAVSRTRLRSDPEFVRNILAHNIADYADRIIALRSQQVTP